MYPSRKSLPGTIKAIMHFFKKNLLFALLAATFACNQQPPLPACDYLKNEETGIKNGGIRQISLDGGKYRSGPSALVIIQRSKYCFCMVAPPAPTNTSKVWKVFCPGKALNQREILQIRVTWNC